MKYCKKCGTQMKDESNFCPSCGFGQSDTAAKTIAKSDKKILYIGIAAVVIIAIMLGGYFYHNKMQTANNAAAPAAQEQGAEIDDSKPKADKIEASDSKAKDVSEYEAIQKELNASGVNGKVLAVAPGDNKTGYLALVRDGSNSGIVIQDKKNNRTALVSNIRNMGDDVVIFDMMVLNDVKDNDVKSGVWEGSNHIIPVYAQYKIDAANNVTPGMLTTGGGRKPSHYQEYFYEQRNVDTINLFLTKMNILNKIAKEKGV